MTRDEATQERALRISQRTYDHMSVGNYTRTVTGIAIEFLLERMAATGLLEDRDDK